MCEFIGFLNENTGAITVILTFILAVVNICQWYLAQKLRKDATKPKVMANVVGKAGELYYRLVNYGATSAVDIKVEIDPYVINRFQKGDYLREKLERIGKGSFSLLPNGEILIRTHTMWNKLKDTSLSLAYTYKDLSGHKYAEEYQFDMSIFNAIITEH